jgi:hypothetical protein
LWRDFSGTKKNQLSNQSKEMAFKLNLVLRNLWQVKTGLLSRHPELSIPKVEEISYGRAMCHNRGQIDVFFAACETLIQEIVTSIMCKPQYI